MECMDCSGKAIIIEAHTFAGTVYRRRRCDTCGRTVWTIEEEAPADEVRAMQAALRAEYRARKRRK